MDETRVKFRDWDCVLKVNRYAVGHGIRLDLESDEGEPVAVCTVNVPGEGLGSREVVIKDWGENEGLLAALQAAGVVGPVCRRFPLGFCTAQVCELLILPPRAEKKPESKKRPGPRALGLLSMVATVLLNGLPASRIGIGGRKRRGR